MIRWNSSDVPYRHILFHDGVIGCWICWFPRSVENLLIITLDSNRTMIFSGRDTSRKSWKSLAMCPGQLQLSPTALPAVGQLGKWIPTGIIGEWVIESETTFEAAFVPLYKSQDHCILWAFYFIRDCCQYRDCLLSWKNRFVMFAGNFGNNQNNNGGGGGGNVGNANNDLFTWYTDIPVVSRTYLTLAISLSTACFMDILSPFSLYFNFELILNKASKRFKNYVY